MIIKKAKDSFKTKPLVSWLIPTTLYGHRWWNRLIEFLEDDFPAEYIECIFLNTQDKGFALKAYKLGSQIAKPYLTSKNAEEKWKRVKFIENYTGDFNLSKSKNILTSLAESQILINRDCDCKLIQYGLTSYFIQYLLEYELGILGVPSLKDGFHFKPESKLPSLQKKQFNNLLLTPSVNGMATIMLKKILLDAGGWNEALLNWGDHTSLCTKLARMGFLMGYVTKRGYFISTSSAEGSITLTDPDSNPYCSQSKNVGFLLLKNFYTLHKDDIFVKFSRKRYYDDKLNDPRNKKLFSQQINAFTKFQKIKRGKQIYNFNPLECLSHGKTEEYITNASSISKNYYQDIKAYIKDRRLENIFNKPPLYHSNTNQSFYPSLGINNAKKTK